MAASPPDAALGDSEPLDHACGPSRRERQVATTRRAILDAARALIDLHGFAETTVDQIAELADVAPRTFFRYFPTKEAVLFAGLEDIQVAVFAGLERRSPDEHPLRSLIVVLHEMAPRMMEDSEELRWGLRVAEEQHVVPAHEQSPMKKRFTEELVQFIAGRLGTSPEADPRPTAWALVVASLFGATMRVCIDPGPDAELGEQFVGLVRETSEALAEGCAGI
jgi:AcrR family transcriptional regulator